ncbi:MAG: geranylgeranylglycerol-phosphate geranylgeranyltransferase [Saprospiraceae bacterium]
MTTTERLNTTHFLRLIRFPNLIIVAFTQFLIQYAVLVPTFTTANLLPALPPIQFSLFVFSTVIIAATGYIINDILDADIDKINQPERLIISKYLSKKRAWQLYFTLTFIGFIISLYLAFFVKNLPLVFIYPSAISLLAAYSFYLKKMPFWGNLVVSIFCAFVPGVVLFAERLTYLQLQSTNYQLFTKSTLIIGGYVTFAFISTLFREIVKDMEDVEGDLRYDCRTLPIAIGIPKTKWIVIAIGVLFLLILVQLATILKFQKWWLALSFSTVFLIIPLLLLLYYLYQSVKPAEFHRVSTGAKLLMLNGLLLLIILAVLY